MTKMIKANDKPAPEGRADIAERLGLVFKNGWYVRPSRGGPPITSEMVQRWLDEADLEDAGLKPRDEDGN